MWNMKARPITYHSKDTVNVKIFADRQAKNYMPPIFRYLGIKMTILRGINVHIYEGCSEIIETLFIFLSTWYLFFISCFTDLPSPFFAVLEKKIKIQFNPFLLPSTKFFFNRKKIIRNYRTCFEFYIFVIKVNLSNINLYKFINYSSKLEVHGEILLTWCRVRKQWVEVKVICFCICGMECGCFDKTKLINALRKNL
jgi:hypothetical protein